jgi:predicted DsbA family dithiol-disulfide isomerase
VAANLASTQDEDVVREEEHRVRALGIAMIPTFILPGGTLVVGAEDPSILAGAMMKCLADTP